MLQAQALEKASSPTNHVSVNWLMWATENNIYPKYLLSVWSKSFSVPRPSLIIVFHEILFPFSWVLTQKLSSVIIPSRFCCLGSPPSKVLTIITWESQFLTFYSHYKVPFSGMVLLTLSTTGCFFPLLHNT